MEIVALITAIAKAIPILDEWMQKLVVYYFNSSVDKMRKENIDAIRKVLVNKDQRDLEKAIGSPSAGLPSGNPESDIVDSLPGVPDIKPKP